MSAKMFQNGYTKTIVAKVASGWLVTLQSTIRGEMSATSAHVPDPDHATKPEAFTAPHVMSHNLHTVAVVQTVGGWLVTHLFQSGIGACLAAAYVPDASHATPLAEFATADYKEVA